MYRLRRTLPDRLPHRRHRDERARVSRSFSLEKCIGCQKCVKICPADALEMFFTPEEQAILAQLAARDEAKTPAAPPAEAAG